jgi:hypothetical protein
LQGVVESLHLKLPLLNLLLDREVRRKRLALEAGTDVTEEQAGLGEEVLAGKRASRSSRGRSGRGGRRCPGKADTSVLGRLETNRPG